MCSGNIVLVGWHPAYGHEKMEIVNDRANRKRGEVGGKISKISYRSKIGATESELRKWPIIQQALLTDSNTKDNSMFNRRVSLVYQIFLERIPPYDLSVYLIECLYSVSRH